MLPDFLPQTTDAVDYLAFGKACAEWGECYNNLRPVGVVWWFSIPFRLGVPPSTLILAHWCLLIVSWFLSVLACRQLLPASSLSNPVTNRLASLALAGFSLLAHVMFLWPVMFNSLSDAPAATLMLSGLWLLVLSRHSYQLPLLFFAAVFLGIATSFRLFYLYIVFGLLVIYFLLWAASRQRKWGELVLLLALLPAVAQYWATWKHAGYVSYIAKDSVSTWQTALLNSPAVGYDTVVPVSPLGVYTDCSRTAGGLITVVEKRDFSGLACFFYHRSRFYLSSYLPYTYIPAPENFKDNLLSHGERPWFKLFWLGLGVGVKEGAVLSPDGIHSAAIIQPTSAGADVAALLSWFRITEPGRYTASMWLWAPKPVTVNVGVIEWDTNITAHSSYRECMLTTVPQRCTLSFDLAKTDAAYALMIGKISKNIPSLYGATGKELFYAWGMQLVSGDVPGEYMPDPRLDERRLWSTPLFVANVVMLLSCIIFLCRKDCLFDRTRLPLLWCMATVFVLGIITVPEQRFVIVTMIIGWCVAITGWMSLVLGWWQSPEKLPRPNQAAVPL
jgi:hypothetical protein